MCIDRKPSNKQKLKALNDHSGKKKYQFYRKGTGTREGWGDVLWEAVLEDSSHCSSQYWSVFDHIVHDEANYLEKDENRRKEIEEEYGEKFTDERWWQFCYDEASFMCEMIEEDIVDLNDDNDVARALGLKFEVIEWDCYNSEVCILSDVGAVCSCGYPIGNNELDYDIKDYTPEETEEYPACNECGEYFFTKDEMVLVGL